ncbi:MAG: T9SS type A sorting domain-containing protein [Bacteroidota bacterium]
MFDNVVISEVAVDGSIEIFNGTDSTVNVGSYWLCDFPTYEQLSSLTLVCGDLNLAPGEVLVVSGFSAFNAADGELGLYTANQFSNSNAIISYLEWGSAGHTRASVAINAGIWTSNFFLPPATADQSLQQVINNDAPEWELATPTLCTPNLLSTGTNNQNEASSMILFPNPTYGNLNVTTIGMAGEESTFEVFDQNGRLVFRTFMDYGNGNTELLLPELRAGTYMLRVTNGSTVLTQRFATF